MKGEKADYIIPLGKIFEQPRTKRTRKIITAVKRFVTKHTKAENVLISTEINNYVTAHSSKLPRKLDTTLVKGEDSIKVYLRSGSQFAADTKAAEEKKKETEAKKKEAEKKAKEAKPAVKEAEPEKKKEAAGEKAEETKKEVAKEDEEKKMLLKEKRERERIASKTEMK
jgi:ribosomal protein L31E